MLFDFEIRNANVNGNALLVKWPTIKFNILSSVKVCERDDCLKKFDENIGYFLALLKMVVQRPKFEEAINILMTFNDVSIEL